MCIVMLNYRNNDRSLSNNIVLKIDSHVLLSKIKLLFVYEYVLWENTNRRRTSVSVCVLKKKLTHDS